MISQASFKFMHLTTDSCEHILAASLTQITVFGYPIQQLMKHAWIQHEGQTTSSARNIEDCSQSMTQNSAKNQAHQRFDSKGRRRAFSCDDSPYRSSKLTDCLPATYKHSSQPPVDHLETDGQLARCCGWAGNILQ